MEILIVLLLFAVVIGVPMWMYKKAHKNTKLGRFVRWHWNTSFKRSSGIPLCGWMARFIIAETEEELRLKEEYIAEGEASDAQWGKTVGEYFDKKASDAKRAEQVRQEILKRGGTDFNIADDGSSATYTDSDGVKVNLEVHWE